MYRWQIRDVFTVDTHHHFVPQSIPCWVTLSPCSCTGCPQRAARDDDNNDDNHSEDDTHNAMEPSAVTTTTVTTKHQQHHHYHHHEIRGVVKLRSRRVRGCIDIRVGDAGRGGTGYLEESLSAQQQRGCSTWLCSTRDTEVWAHRAIAVRDGWRAGSLAAWLHALSL